MAGDENKVTLGQFAEKANTTEFSFEAELVNLQAEVVDRVMAVRPELAEFEEADFMALETAKGILANYGVTDGMDDGSTAEEVLNSAAQQISELSDDEFKQELEQNFLELVRAIDSGEYDVEPDVSFEVYDENDHFTHN